MKAVSVCRLVLPEVGAHGVGGQRGRVSDAAPDNPEWKAVLRQGKGVREQHISSSLVGWPIKDHPYPAANKETAGECLVRVMLLQ